MKRSTSLSLLLAAVVILPAAAAGIGQQMDSSQQTRTEAGSQQASAQSDYTQLYVEDQYRSLELKPGQSETVSVDVENGEDRSVTIRPHLFAPGVGEPPIKDDWVSISDTEITLDERETVTVNATVEIPEDAELGRYNGVLAMTNETISYPGRPAHPVHSANLNVEVFKEPTVTIESGSYGHTQAKAGSTTTHEIVVKNSGDQAVPLNPQVSIQDNHRRGSYSQSLERSWFDISAPAEVEPGETATVEVTISPPNDADRGRYDTEIDLGIQDPARSSDDDYWQQVDLNVEVWEPPTEPFEREFEVVNGTESVTLTLSTNDHYQSDDGPAPSFDVTFVSPSGTEVEAERVERSTSGHVSLADRARPTQSQDGPYSSGGAQQEFVYRIENPAAGTWSAEIMPENAIEFEYDVTRTESSD
jgi:Tfp pilus assembly protein PilV